MVQENSDVEHVKKEDVLLFADLLGELPGVEMWLSGVGLTFLSMVMMGTTHPLRSSPTGYP